MQQNERQHRPGHPAACVKFTPGLGPPSQPQSTAANQQRCRHTQLHRQMQRQVMRIVQNVAKARSGVQRYEMGVIQLTPAPAEPGFLGNQVQHVAPQSEAAGASRAAVIQSRQNAGGMGVKVDQKRQGECGHPVSQRRRQQNAPYIRLPPATPNPGHAHQHPQLHQPRAR